VILTFYPRDFTPGCTRHLCAFRDAHAAVDRLQAVVLAVSYDSPDSHRRFAEAERLPFTLLSDGDRAISRRYGAARFGGLFPVPRRMTVVIDRRGIVRSIIRSEFAVGRHLEESLEVLQRIVAEEEGGSPLR
jgi:peroxiredoxin Q/BCP